MLFGYARVSTKDQNLELQLDALKNYGVPEKNIYYDKQTGTTADRPQYKKLMDKLREGDTIVIYKLDRISRSTKHLIKLSEEFKELGVEFISIREKIDTSSAIGNFFFLIMSAIAQLERDIISERTKAGLESARSRGRLGGRPKTDEQTINKAIEMYRSKKYTVKEITQLTGISKTTLYKYL